jgi:hypothetical protein
MRKTLVPVCCALVAALATGCAKVGEPQVDTSATGPKVDRTPPVTQSSSPNRAVLSLHMKKAYADACMFGLTLANTLPYKIKDIAFKFTVYLRSGVAYNQVTRNFFDLNPTDRQYREITFNGVTCAEIERVEVSDAGRCTMDDLGRFNAKPGDCLKRVEVASSPHVSFIRK